MTRANVEMWTKSVAGSALVIAANCAQAIDFDYAFFTSVGYSDNLAQTTPNPIFQIEEEPGRTKTGGIDFSLGTTQNNQLAFNANGSFSRTDYSLDEVSSDSDKNLEASLFYQPEGRNFSLSVLDSLEQVELDRQSSITINNVRDINTFSAVPSYFVRLSPISQLTTEYQFVKISDDDGGSSSEANSIRVGYQKQFLSDVSWSMNVAKTRTNFDMLDGEFNQEEAFLRINNESGLTLYDFRIGRQRVTNADVEPETFSYQNSISWSINRQINTYSRLNLVMRQGFGDYLNIDLGNNIVRISSNEQSGFIEGIVKEKQATIDYTYNNRSLLINTSIGGRTLEGDDEVANNSASIDDEETFASLLISDQLVAGAVGRGTLNYTASYEFTRTKFNLAATEFESNEISVRLTYRSSEKLETFLELSSRDVSGEGQAREYEERRAVIGLRFSPRGLR